MRRLLPTRTPDKKIDTTPRPRRREAKIRECFQSVPPILRVRLRSSHAPVAVAVKIHRDPSEVIPLTRLERPSSGDGFGGRRQ